MSVPLLKDGQNQDKIKVISVVNVGKPVLIVVLHTLELQKNHSPRA